MGLNRTNLGDVTIETTGTRANGILAVQDQGSDPDIVGNVEVHMLGGVSITTAGDEANGVWAHHRGEHRTIKSDVVITARGRNIITTSGDLGHGLRGELGSASGAPVGKVRMDLENIEITTKGADAVGLIGNHFGIGDIEIGIRNATIVTEGTNIRSPSRVGTLSHGVFAWNRNLINPVESGGDINIDVQGGSIETRGTYSYGIRGDLEAGNGGEISITTGGGHRITTTGANGHGIVAYHWDTTQASSSISIDVGGNIDVSGAGAQGVRVGALDADDAPARVAAIGEDGYRRQAVTVNGAVTSAAEGVYLAGGGRVVIGPRGSIASDSGVAIFATGDTPVDGGDPIKPKLRVDLNLGGRRVAQAIGDDWILNDGGETTIAMNNAVLHEGATGVTGRTARNGAWNVRMRAEGVTVNRGDPADPDPANWAFTEPAAGVVADRDFSAGDFRETRRRCPRGQVGTPPNCATPPPPMCPEGQVGTPPDCMTPPKPVLDGSGDAVTVFLEGGGRVVKHVFDGLLDAAVDFLEDGGQDAGESSAGVVDGRYFSTEDSIATPGSRQFHEVYAPRAAIYEALPGFLLRLNGGGPEGKRLRTPGSPVWARLSGSTGSHAPERSTVGQEYDFERLAVEAGLEVAMGEHFTGSISVRHVSGSAEVSAPTGGGDIEAKGIGVSLGASWKGAGGYYANGRLSLTDYDVDVSSGDRSVGTLQKDAAARGALLSLEAGRRIEMSERMNLTPRAWATRSATSADDFTDKVAAQVSIAGAARLTGGVGVIAETARAFEGGTLSLRGSVDLAQTLDDAETAVDVSGERLESKASKTRFLLGLGGVYRMGRFSVSGEVSMGGLGSGDTQYAGRVSIGMRF